MNNNQWSPADKLILALIEVGTLDFEVRRSWNLLYNTEVYSIDIASDSIHHTAQANFDKYGYPLLFESFPLKILVVPLKS